MNFQHELRFDISDIELKKIECRLKSFMNCERNSNIGYRLIRSLYFDDYKNSCIESTIADLDERREYRIRTYDNDIESIRLEKKTKKRSMIHKDVAYISKEDCLEYMSGHIPTISDSDDELTKEFYANAKALHMMPVCIVEYERTSFLYDIGNVNIAFDRNIRGSRHVKDFFEQTINAVPVMETGHNILEINYDTNLPHFILSAINLGSLRRQSFSKYMQVRLAVGI